MTREDENEALVKLGRWLEEARYRFVTPTPETYRRVNARPENAETTTVVGALGWSRPFRAGGLPAEVERLLTDAKVLHVDGDFLRADIRFSTVPGHDDDDQRDESGASLYVHSAYPTASAEAVFFGPDTYRFVSLLRRTVRPARRLVDIGCGSGVGGLCLLDRAQELVLGDVNETALRYARINAALASARTVDIVASDVLAAIEDPIDAVIANPPYLVDPEQRLYRHGGGALGFDLSVRIVSEALARLPPGGQLVLYTGSPVIDGEHPLRAALAARLLRRPCRHRWEELDPDVFGEELERPAYQGVERIAVVALVVDVR